MNEQELQKVLTLVGIEIDKAIIRGDDVENLRRIFDNISFFITIFG